MKAKIIGIMAMCQVIKPIILNKTEIRAVETDADKKATFVLYCFVEMNITKNKQTMIPAVKTPPDAVFIPTAKSYVLFA